MDTPPPWAGTVPPGSSLLVAGEPLTGKRALLYPLLAAGRDPETAATVLVTTRKDAETVATEYRRVQDLPESRLGVIDCVTLDRGVDVSDRETRRYMYDPGDMTGIGIHTSEFMRQFDADEGVESVRIGLHTLSTMLMYTELRWLYQFLHVMTGRIAASGHVGVFVVDEAPGSGRLNMLVQPFDGLVEVRQKRNREIRVRGLSVGPDEWTPI